MERNRLTGRQAAARCCPGVGIVLVLVGLCLQGGCKPQSDNSSPDSPESAPAATPREVWKVQYIKGTKVGYGRTTSREIDRAGRRLIEIEGLDHLTVKRFGETTEQKVRFTCTETPDGTLIDFQTELAMGPVPLLSKGRVEGNELIIETTTQGKTSTTRIPWSADYGGFQATEQTLRRKPLGPGEKRTIHALMPGFNQVAAVEMSAGDFQPVKLLTGTYNLLAIDTTITFAGGQSIKGTMWTDRTGEVLKDRSEAMGLESFQTTKAQALDKTDAGGFDLGLDVTVKVDRPIDRPHDTSRIRYRVHLADSDPAGAFVAGASQQVESIDEHTARITVYALRPDSPAVNPDASSDPPSDADRLPNNLIQSDDPLIVKMAAEAAGDTKDAWSTAVALEGYVKRIIKLKDFSQAFATAAEVARSRVGDCTEHAVLLAALARARKIPARVAIGLVYMQGTQSFGYHMWNEVYIGKRWIPLDATLGRGGIGAAHLKLVDSSLEGASAYSSFLPIVHVAGRLKIEVLDVKGGRAARQRERDREPGFRDQYPAGTLTPEFGTLAPGPCPLTPS